MFDEKTMLGSRVYIQGYLCSEKEKGHVLIRKERVERELMKVRSNLQLFHLWTSS